MSLTGSKRKQQKQKRPVANVKEYTNLELEWQGGTHWMMRIAKLPAKKKDDKKNKSTPKQTNATQVCSKCKQPGHLHPTNKLCMYYVPPKKSRSKKKSSDNQAPTVADDMLKSQTDGLTIDNEMAAMAEELDELDTMPFESDGSSDAFFSAASEFSDS
jgi:hypothetical protein